MKKCKRTIQYIAQFGFLFVIVCIINACSKDGHVFVKLPETHLEETHAGFWLAIFEIDYSPGAERLKRQVLDKLRSEGTLIDESVYQDGANNVTTRVWKYRGEKIKEEYYKGGIWKGPKVVPFQEYYNGGWNSWITIEFDEGVPYSKLLPSHHNKINPNRKYGHTATIESAIDQKRRLFLFGYGSWCQRISLF